MSLLQETSSDAAPEIGSGRNASDAMAAFLAGGLRDELALTPSDLRIGLTVAKNLLARNAKAEAMRIYVALVLCEPTHVDFQVGLANCAGLLEEHHLALQAASAVIALAPSDPRGYLLSGRSCLALGSLPEARQDLEDALGLARSQGQTVVAQEATSLLGRLDNAES